ncbi:MAG: diguanylate cyclase [Bacillota bacterium]|nr:diguanylate cyclase [Bacillota bacterium]
MPKVNLYVCENHYPEYRGACVNQEMADVAVIPFPATCIDKTRITEAVSLFTESTASDSEGVVLCSKHCDICALVPPNSFLKVHPADYCFSHLASKSFINYVMSKGAYIIGSGWLRNWRQRVADTGFDQVSARNYYHGFCKELVFFDAGFDPDAEKDLTELSLFLGLPYKVVPVELDLIQLMISSALTELRLHTSNADNRHNDIEIQAQCAEYAAIFDLMGRIYTDSNKRDAIEKIKDLFLTVFGAQLFCYWNNDLASTLLPEEIKTLLLDEEREFILSKEDNRFFIKIMWREQLFGVIDVSGFLFPEYIEKYLNFALEIAKICGLVFSNNVQYESAFKSEQDLRYASTHDALTGLYNRTYINEIIEQQTQDTPFTVFMFDIDRLKFINDHYGHAEGDKLIICVASILKKCFRENDIVARIGGDEFVTIMQGKPMESSDMIARRIKRQIEIHNSNRHDDHLKVSFSIGYATSRKPDDLIETVMNSADEQMYKDKASR